MKRAAAGNNRLAWSSKYCAACRPIQSFGSSSSGSRGSVNRNLRHSWTSWLRAAKAASSDPSGSIPATISCAAASHSLVGRLPARRGPTPAGRAPRCRRRGVAVNCSATNLLGVEQGVQLARRAGRQPGGVVDRAVAEVAQPDPEPFAPGAVAHPVDDEQVPVAVPGLVAGAVDPRAGLVEAAHRARRERVARPGRGPDRDQPVLADHSGHRGTDRWRGDVERAQASDQGRPRAPVRPGWRGGRRRGRTAQIARSPGQSDAPDRAPGAQSAIMV